MMIDERLQASANAKLNKGAVKNQILSEWYHAMPIDEECHYTWNRKYQSYWRLESEMGWGPFFEYFLTGTSMFFWLDMN